MTFKLLGNRSQGLLFVVSAPAGTGKTTLVEMLTAEFPCVVKSISFTTRAARPGEAEGIDYYFISEENFKAKIVADEFLEHVQLYGNRYGTSRQKVENLLQQGFHVVLVIDTQGAKLLKQKCKARYIFIAPPSMGELQQRLEKRKTENAETILERLAIAEEEIAALAEYDYCIVNDDLAIAYKVLQSIFIAEDHRIENRPD